MNKLIINLQGVLSAELGSELYLKCKEIYMNPVILLINAEDVSLIDPIGWEFIRKIRNHSRDKKGSLHVCNLHPKWHEDWIGVWEDTSKIFPTKDEAIQDLEDSTGITPILVSSQVESKDSTETGEIFCPHCGSFHESIGLGVQTCNHCGGSFYIYKNGAVNPYEKLV